MKRTIIIGDIHGCMDELLDLLKKISPTPQDQLIAVGDLICKGPDSRGVLDWAMAAKNLRCIQGNFELQLLSYWKQGTVPEDQLNYVEVYRQMGADFDRYMHFIDTWPLTIPTKDYLVVHAGFDPRKPIADQPAEQLTNIRRLDGGDTPWYEAYKGRKLVVFGHWAQLKPTVRKNAVGLDTGCVYGGLLSALVLPERRIVSVRARKAYVEKEPWSKIAAGDARAAKKPR